MGGDYSNGSGSPRNLSLNLTSQYLGRSPIRGQTLPTNVKSTASASSDADAKAVRRKTISSACAKPQSDSINKNNSNIKNINNRNCKILGGVDPYDYIHSINDNVNVSKMDGHESCFYSAASIDEMINIRAPYGDSGQVLHSHIHNACQTATKKPKLSKLGTKTVGLKRSERSVVRVSIYQSSQPQHIYTPEYFTKYENTLDKPLSNYNCNFEDIMTTPLPSYDRQQSTDSGWDNPFRPGGDLSREADEIVKMISGGKPITPTEDHAIGNGKTQKNDTSNGKMGLEEATKTNVSQNQSAQNGTMYRTQTVTLGGVVKSTDNNGMTSLAQVSNQLVPGPTSASHVIIDEKKSKKKGCCVIQ
ncbi:uncharacterized protein LOC119637554 isoform X2 [Glossina fuscipes]|uniref:Uncharacterized protein LOC119637554 isoform X2 n=1 Tax=Glossina fuscipes TaxID=7396 RepID=A0A9C5Z481_9MUSC|nr:uncharacterized protein LOC119637554 isoform X2 [Glossina fuscipes]